MLRKITIGIWLEKKIKEESGGAFTYYNALIQAIAKHDFINSNVIFIDEQSENNYQLEGRPVYGFKTNNSLNFKTKVIFRLGKIPLFKSFVSEYFKKINEDKEKQLVGKLKKICDVVYYPTPYYKTTAFPYITTLWDLGQHNNYTFPSIVSHRDIETYLVRRNSYEYLFNKAIFIVCESNAGKGELIKYFSINEDKIVVLPMFPSEIVEDTIQSVCPNKLKKNEIYIHYNSNYGEHKNHYNLILAFKVIADKYPDLKLVLTGSDTGNKSYIFKIIKDLGIQNRVIDMGFVSIEELKYIYQHSRALVYPSFLGPTNMPPLEALLLNCPVCISNLKGHREQLGDLALYFNPLRPTEIANCIETVMRKEKKANSEHLKVQVNKVSDSLKILEAMFKDAASIRFTWE